MIAKAQQAVGSEFRLLAPILGDPHDGLAKTRLIEFGRHFDQNVPELLRPLVVQAYGIGVEKARSDDRDRAPIEVHASQASEWMHRVRERITNLTDGMLAWFEQHSLHRFQEADLLEAADEVIPVKVFLDRWTHPVETIGLGLWTVYQAGYANGLGAAGASRLEEAEDDDEEALVNYVAVGDANTCGPCADAAAASPYTADSVPFPGEVCEGGDNCRCELEFA